MKKILQVTAIAGLISVTALVQAEAITANVSLTSDYVWRGLSQNQNNGAIQGGFDYNHDSGFYLGVWASNVDYDSETSIEMDYYAGYVFQISDSVSVDVGVLEYTYVDESSLNFTEASISISAAGFKLGYNTSGAITSDESMDYIALDYGTEIKGVGVSAHVGRYDTKDENFLTESDYLDYSVSVSKEYLGVSLALTYTDTNLDSDECEAFAGDSDYCDAIVAVSISKSL